MTEQSGMGRFGRAITRRQFLRRAGLTGAGLAAAACAPQIVEVEKEVSVDKIVIQEKEVTAVPVIHEYVVKHPISQDPQGLDPNNPMMPSNKEMGYMYNEGLYRLTTKGIEPNLATAMPSSENGGKRWVIPLREGVKFHNGNPFTAADVKYSLDFIKENGLFRIGMSQEHLAEVFAEYDVIACSSIFSAQTRMRFEAAQTARHAAGRGRRVLRLLGALCPGAVWALPG